MSRWLCLLCICFQQTGALGKFIHIYPANDDWDCLCFCFNMQVEPHVVAFGSHRMGNDLTIWKASWGGDLQLWFGLFSKQLFTGQTYWTGIKTLWELTYQHNSRTIYPANNFWFSERSPNVSFCFPERYILVIQKSFLYGHWALLSGSRHVLETINFYFCKDNQPKTNVMGMFCAGYGILFLGCVFGLSLRWCFLKYLLFAWSSFSASWHLCNLRRHMKGG